MYSIEQIRFYFLSFFIQLQISDKYMDKKNDQIKHCKY